MGPHQISVNATTRLCYTVILLKFQHQSHTYLATYRGSIYFMPWWMPWQSECHK